MGGGSSGSGHGDHSSGGADEKDVIVLTDSDFDSRVYGDDSPWFV